MFSLTKSVLTSLFSISTLLLGGTKLVVQVETILEDERPYPKPGQLEVLGHMCFSCYRTYVMILCNWLIL